MNLITAMVLGLVQGFAEFLPISSSGHLVVIGHLLGIKDSNIAFDVFLHFATLLAILIYFKKDILSIKLNEIKAIIIGSIPATLVGLLFKDQFEALFGSVLIVSVFLIITGFLNLMTDSKLNKLNDSVVIKKEVGIKEALIIGIFQAFAILPGISRSGSTVAGGVLQNIDREKAFRFSFLMVIPVVF
ncbi:MAG TPA: undecaprenyl-diphosphate phosphatase, partial [Candidatus Woesebacteria bacterium]|nr:undecaprenyl-diphosphate phosphatase [Candidatus Woesebacteria bacterium]